MRRPWLSPDNTVRFTIAVLPLACWLYYIHITLHSIDAGWTSMTWPLAGLVEKVRADVAALGRYEDHVLTWSTLAATVRAVRKMS